MSDMIECETVQYKGTSRVVDDGSFCSVNKKQNLKEYATENLTACGLKRYLQSALIHSSYDGLKSASLPTPAVHL